jgi:hypothetical protein
MHMMSRIKRLSASLAFSSLALLTATAGTIANAAAQTTTPPKTIALVSMVGDEFTYVVQRERTGSNIIDHYKRTTVRVPGQGINMSVLRGLDEAVRREHPESERVLLAIPHDMNTLPPAPKEREEAAFKKAMSLLEQFPQRKDWDQIVLVTPRWLFSERGGMASKLSGVGLYVQPLESAKLESDNGENLLSDLGLQLEEEVDTLKRGQTARSQTYVAPFFYAVVSTIDAKTMRVIKREERYDFRKITNPDSTALRVQASFEPEQLAGAIDKFIETAALRSVTEKRGTVEIGPVRDSRTQPAPAPEKK